LVKEVQKAECNQKVAERDIYFLKHYIHKDFGAASRQGRQLEVGGPAENNQDLRNLQKADANCPNYNENLESCEGTIDI